MGNGEEQKTQPLADRILDLLRGNYIISGYLYSGCMSPHLIARRLDETEEAVMPALLELNGRGLARQRECTAFMFQLSGAERVRLIREHNLGRVWEEGDGRVFYPNSQHGECTYARQAAEAEAGDGRAEAA